LEGDPIMSAQLYFLLIGGIALAAFVLLVWSERQRSFNENLVTLDEDSSLPMGGDALTSELSARIFDPEDSDFVDGETSRQLARSFRRQRATLALDWLEEVRKEVSLLMRAHRGAARDNPDLKPADEVQLGFQFLLFQVTTGILYRVIWLIGPLHAARLVGYSLELAGQVRKMSEDILPASAQVAVELLDIEGQEKNRTATR
jgi:hypothetical protein